MPAPNIVWDKEREQWKCTVCKQVGFCICLGDMEDPICDCGWPGYACKCHLKDEEELKMIEEEEIWDEEEYNLY